MSNLSDIVELRVFFVDAFTDHVFSGNGAAVVPLEDWLPTETLQLMAREHNLSETVFLVPTPDDAEHDYHIRWFTPTVEAQICGHATLAAAHTLWRHLGYGGDQLRLRSRSGRLKVEQDIEGRLVLNFPVFEVSQEDDTALINQIVDAIGSRPVEIHKATSPVNDLCETIAVFDRASDVQVLAPNFAKVGEVPRSAIIATAPGEAGSELDFVSRYFCPQSGIDEDPVTGTGHCVLTPYWSSRLGQKSLRARQISARGGDVLCQFVPDDPSGLARVHLAGRAVTYMEGVARIPVDTVQPAAAGR